MEALGNAPQYCVAAARAERGVDELEMLQVDEEKPDMLALNPSGGEALVNQVEQGAAVRQLGQKVRTRHRQYTVALDLQRLHLFLQRGVRFQKGGVGVVELQRLLFQNPLGFLARQLLAGHPPLQQLKVGRGGFRELDHQEARARVNRTDFTSASSCAAAVMWTGSSKIVLQPWNRPNARFSRPRDET